jgi:hypothetical protein
LVKFSIFELTELHDMKAWIWVFITVAALLCGCAKRKFQKEIVGAWVPYEIVHSDGTVDSGPFAFRSIFGVYAESVQFRKDKTYVPMQEFNTGELSPKTAETGKYAYNPDYAELSLTGGVIDMKFTVEKVNDDHLWLYSSVTRLHSRFRRH